jgi:hypothetical protein
MRIFIAAVAAGVVALMLGSCGGAPPSRQTTSCRGVCSSAPAATGNPARSGQASTPVPCHTACQSTSTNAPVGGTVTGSGTPVLAPSNRPADTAVPSPLPPASKPAASVLTYTIHSDARRLLTVTYVANSGQTEHASSTSGNWTKTITPSGVRLPVLTAVGDGSGTFVSCSIVRDGVVMESNRANGGSVACRPGELTAGGTPSGSKQAG